MKHRYFSSPPYTVYNSTEFSLIYGRLTIGVFTRREWVKDYEEDMEDLLTRK
jgi:hypothetical protein